MSFTENFGRQPRALIVAEMAAELLVIAAFDFVTQRHVLPACLLSWRQTLPPPLR